MTRKSYLILPILCLLVGCNSSKSVLCVAPTGEFKPQSEAELLAELNAHIPFVIPEKRFAALVRMDNGLASVGWAVVRNDKEKDLAKAELKKSTTLKLLQVKALTPEIKELFELKKFMKQQKP